MDLYGSENDGVDYAAVDPMLVPCMSRITLFDGKEIGADDDCIQDQLEVQEYMGQGYNMIRYANSHMFNEDTYQDEKIIEHKSMIDSVFSVSYNAVWTESWVEQNELIDEIDLFQIGQQTTFEFTSITTGVQRSTKFNVWPTKDDPKVYKFNGFWIELRQYRTTIERQTYNVLEWVGDIGGLYDGLIIIARQLVSPFAAFALNSQLLSHVFKKVDSKKIDEGHQEKF